MSKIIPVILCGGSGTRLWPLSRKHHPKQFMDLGAGRTLFGDTVKRGEAIPNCAPPICVGNESYRFYMAPHIKNGRMILEPCAKNTAPAIALASIAALQVSGDDLLLVMPSDHYFGDNEAFAKAVAEAAPHAESGQIITFGLKPKSAHTGFGYIETGQELGNGVFKVASFLEKPDQARADQIANDGLHYWNMGIFLFRPKTFLDELNRYQPGMLAVCQQAMAEGDRQENLIRPKKEIFETCLPDSIDYAVMEQTDKASVKLLDCVWDDMGSWESFYANGDRDERDNVVSGRSLPINSDSCYIHSTNRLIAALGVKNLAIIETPDSLLVMDRNQAQQVKQITNQLEKTGAREFLHHRIVQKPWGSYEVLSEGERFQVKHIIVKPGHSISLQMHHHRAEHWIVVSGTAEITNGDEKRLFTENQSTYIPVGIVHKLHNPGLIPLSIIEIQSGAYLGEDDIVRLEDPYARIGKN